MRMTGKRYSDRQGSGFAHNRNMETKNLQLDRNAVRMYLLGLTYSDCPWSILARVVQCQWLSSDSLAVGLALLSFDLGDASQCHRVNYQK